MATEGASDSSDKAIVRAFERQQSIICVYVVCCVRTVFLLVAHRTVRALKVMDAIFLAVSVDAAPGSYRVTYNGVKTSSGYQRLSA